MKLSRKKLGAGIAAAGALLIAASVVFSQRPSGPPPGGGFRDLPFGRDLNLSDEQQAQIKKIRDSFRESDQALLDQLKSLRDSQADPLTGSFDETSVRANAESRARIQIELDVSRAKMMSQIGALLTADQKAQLAARRKQFERQGPPPPPDQP